MGLRLARTMSFMILVTAILAPANGATLQSSLVLSATTTVKSPSVVFQKGNIANSTIYTNSTSATVNTPTLNYPTSYNIVNGTFSSGTVPGSVNAIDTNYFTTASAGTNPRTESVEFILAVASTAPAQLNFTIVEQYSIGSVSVTIQVFNYTANAYSTNGQGFFTYTSSGTSGTDETQSLTITTNPQSYTSGGLAKVRITGSHSGNYNQNVNFVRLYYYTTTYNYVLKIVNQQPVSYSIKLDASPFSPSNIGRVSNFTAWFYNPASVQLQVLSGSMTIQTGPAYTLGSSATIFLAIRLTTTSAGLSTVDCYLRIYPSGSTTTHTDYRLTFKMT